MYTLNKLFFELQDLALENGYEKEAKILSDKFIKSKTKSEKNIVFLELHDLLVINGVLEICNKYKLHYLSSNKFIKNIVLPLVFEILNNKMMTFCEFADKVDKEGIEVFKLNKKIKSEWFDEYHKEINKIIGKHYSEVGGCFSDIYGFNMSDPFCYTKRNKKLILGLAIESSIIHLALDCDCFV